MGLSFGYQPLPSEEQGLELIKHAYDQGVTFFDTADMYGPFTNEVLVGKVEE
jgi:aryl-alcohol dehydrogenase-like predicted oxidoreductase